MRVQDASEKKNKDSWEDFDAGFGTLNQEGEGRLRLYLKRSSGSVDNTQSRFLTCIVSHFFFVTACNAQLADELKIHQACTKCV